MTTRNEIDDLDDNGARPDHRAGKAVFALIVCALIISTSALSASTNASAASASQIITSDQAYIAEIIVPSDRTVKFEVEVYSGPNIDIFLLDESNFILYSNGEKFISYGKGTFLGTSHASWEISLKDGSYYLVMSRIGTDGTASSFVNYAYSFAGSGGANVDDNAASDIVLLILILVVVTALIIALVVGLLLSRKREASTEVTSVSHATPSMVTKYCRYCGLEISGDGVYCPKCGKKLD